MSASDEATLKKNWGELNPPQSWLWKQNGTTVVAAVWFSKLCTTEAACFKKLHFET